MSFLKNLRRRFVRRFAPFFRGPDPRHVRQRNIWHHYQDLLWLGLATAAANSINVYAIRLGPSEQLIGLRTAIPSLLMVLLRIPAARLTERTPDRKGLTVVPNWVSICLRMCYTYLLIVRTLCGLLGCDEE